MKMKRAKIKAMIEIVKLQFHPLFSSTQIITVDAMSPPETSEKKNQLKKAEISRGLLRSS